MISTFGVWERAREGAFFLRGINNNELLENVVTESFVLSPWLVWGCPLFYFPFFSCVCFFLVFGVGWCFTLCIIALKVYTNTNKKSERASRVKKSRPTALHIYPEYCLIFDLNQVASFLLLSFIKASKRNKNHSKRTIHTTHINICPQCGCLSVSLIFEVAFCSALFSPSFFRPPQIKKLNKLQFEKK